ncbi:hypothetical protein ACIBTV_27590 [Micromonospora sp. NPDC049366]|uniref:hypothetical protein n=1 Tax=Micromonospora sp. NPDC049366 TaxID=3364271 RepID=UPI003790589D
MIDANITAPEEPGDPAATEAANQAWAAGEEMSPGNAAFVAVFGHLPRVDAPRTDDLYELPEDGDEDPTLFD